ncbi:MAG: PD-(D/E)XK nuclease family protein [Xanthomonadaceae bacterium]|nr:PD-(D/E)XK nuclease family protein [Xanthomonadaceae bacterium]
MHVELLGRLIGIGFLREEIKDQLLSQNIPLSGHVILSLEEIALKVLKLENVQLIRAASRRELLKQIFLKPAISRQFPELYKLRRQRKFYENLDQSVQESRSFYSNEHEREAFHSLLDEKCGARPLRHEVAKLTLFFEVYLSARHLYDETRLIKEAAAVPRDEINLGDDIPRNWMLISDRKLVSIEKQLMDHLGFKLTEPENHSKSLVSQIQIEEWHTPDDAAEGLLDELVQVDPELSQKHAIIFSGNMQSRLSLQLAMQSRGLIEESPRDPLYWKNKEDLKSALIPFTLMSSRFGIDEVIEFILLTRGQSVSTQIWIKEIMNRGIREGLSSYQGGKLSDLHTRLKKISDSWSGKKTLTELRDVHLDFLMTIPLSGETFNAIEKLYDGMLDEEEYGVFKSGRESLWSWSERILDRIKDFTAPAPILRSNSGIQIFRHSQSSLSEFDHVWFFGIEPKDLIHHSIGNLAFSDREREYIGREFDCDTASIRTEKTIEAFLSWFTKSDSQIQWHSSRLSWNGSENEQPSLMSSLLEKRTSAKLSVNKRGAHPRWWPSYLTRGAHSLPLIKVSNVVEPSQLSASHLDRYSRCAFTYLAMNVWKAEDRRVSEIDLWPDVRGTILHDSVTEVLKSGVKPTEAVNTAWTKNKIRGLIPSIRLEKLLKRRLVEIVTLFKEKDDEYKERSETKTIALDDMDLLMERSGVKLQGRPDRIDEHKDGLFIMDFKSTSSLPSGQDMVERGYRLQLPFYALALEEKLKKPIIGVQFIELTKKPSRSKGIFFEQWNGKTAGKLTNTRSKLNVFSSNPDEVWKRADSHILSTIEKIKNNEFSAEPKDVKECRLCAYMDLCQKRRFAAQSEPDIESVEL